MADKIKEFLNLFKGAEAPQIPNGFVGKPDDFDPSTVPMPQLGQGGAEPVPMPQLGQESFTPPVPMPQLGQGVGTGDPSQILAGGVTGLLPSASNALVPQLGNTGRQMAQGTNQIVNIRGASALKGASLPMLAYTAADLGTKAVTGRGISERVGEGIGSVVGQGIYGEGQAPFTDADRHQQLKKIYPGIQDEDALAILSGEMSIQRGENTPENRQVEVVMPPSPTPQQGGLSEGQRLRLYGENNIPLLEQSRMISQAYGVKPAGAPTVHDASRATMSGEGLERFQQAPSGADGQAAAEPQGAAPQLGRGSDRFLSSEAQANNAKARAMDESRREGRRFQKEAEAHGMTPAQYASYTGGQDVAPMSEYQRNQVEIQLQELESIKDNKEREQKRRDIGTMADILAKSAMGDIDDAAVARIAEALGLSDMVQPPDEQAVKEQSDEQGNQKLSADELAAHKAANAAAKEAGEASYTIDGKSYNTQ